MPTIRFIVNTDDLDNPIEVTDKTVAIDIYHYEGTTWYAGKLQSLLEQAIEEQRCIYKVRFEQK